MNKDEAREIVKKIFGMSPEMKVASSSFSDPNPEPYMIIIPFILDIRYHNTLDGSGTNWKEALNDLLSNIDNRRSFYEGKVQEAEKERVEYGKARDLLAQAQQKMREWQETGAVGGGEL